VDYVLAQVNMSVWEPVEALAAYVYSGTHRQVSSGPLHGPEDWTCPA
jgi:hypothetical protein